MPIVLISWLSDRGERLAWPVARHFESYLFHGAVVLAGFVWLWMLHANVDSRGDPAPLPYLPLLNPLDLTQITGLMALFAWFKRMRKAPFAPPIFQTSELAYASATLAGESRLSAARDYKTLVLWGSLIFGVSLLGWMALGLSRQVSNPPAESSTTENSH